MNIEDWEEQYYYNNSISIGNDLEIAKRIAKEKFDSMPSPYIVRIYDNTSGKCVFSLRK